MSRVWLITGASSGFGRALTEAAVAEGDTVVAASRHTASLDDLVAAHPDQVDAITLDVADSLAARTAVADVIARHGRIDVLVNGAGRTHVGAVEETSDAELRGLFDVHLFGPAALVRAALPHLRAQGEGAIVQFSSMGGQLSFAGFGAYSATKFALEGLSEALAEEVAPFGIRVLIVEPGAFRTGLFRSDRATASEPSDVYAATVGPTRDFVAGGDGTQPGDPRRAARAIITALDADEPPLRLVLGDDAVEAIRAHQEQLRTELAAWEAVSRDTAIATADA